MHRRARDLSRASAARNVFAVAVVFIATLGLGIACVDFAGAQTRTVKLVVPFPAGGGADLLARVLMEQVGRAQGVATVVENRPGAGAVIGTEAAMRAAPDGNTLLVTSNAFVIHPSLKKVAYDPLASFEPVCLLAISPLVIAVNGASPYRTIAELFAAARTKPGELSFASVGPASAQHIAFEKLKLLSKADMVYVPFSGGAPTVNALLGGHVTASFSNYSEVAEHLASGKLRVLATASPIRIEPLPDVPTMQEAGFTDYAAEVWYGLNAPAKTPDGAVNEMGGWIGAAMKSPELVPKLKAQGLYPKAACGAPYAAHLRQQFDDYARVIQAANIKAE